MRFALATDTNRVVFFCTGNTCRSPLAEIFARLAATGCQLDSSIEFFSAGLQANGGQLASEGSVSVAGAAGLDLSQHLSQQICPELLTGVTWAVGMTRSHVALFKARYGGLYAGRIGLLGEPGVDQSSIQHSAEVEEVADPYGGSLQTYQAVGEQIQRLVKVWVPVLGNKKIQDGGTM